MDERLTQRTEWSEQRTEEHISPLQGDLSRVLLIGFGEPGASGRHVYTFVQDP